MIRVAVLFWTLPLLSHASISLMFDHASLSPWLIGTGPSIEFAYSPLILEIYESRDEDLFLLASRTVQKPQTIHLSVSKPNLVLYFQDERSGRIYRHPESGTLSVGDWPRLGLKVSEVLPRDVVSAKESSTGATQYGGQTDEWAGEVLFRFVGNQSLPDRHEILKRNTVKNYTRTFWSPRFKLESYIASVSDTGDLRTLILNPDADFAWIHPNYRLRQLYLPDEFDDVADIESKQYHLKRTETHLAWDREIADTVTPSVIAVTDIGVALEHPDLINKLWVNALEDLNGNGLFDPEPFPIGDVDNIDQDANGRIDDVNGWHFIDIVADSPNPRPRTNDGIQSNGDEGHGTHVAGIIAAETDNASEFGETGLAGVSVHSQIMALRVGDAGLFGQMGSLDQLVASYAYAYDNGAKVVSTSLGTYEDDLLFGTEALEEIIDTLWAHDVLVVAAVGNNGQSIDADPVYPASIPRVVGVSASDSLDGILLSSNQGSQVSVAAPGDSIQSTYWGVGDTLTRVKKSGTSMACPQVSALAGILFAVSPGISNEQVLNRIQSTADKVGTFVYDPTTSRNIYFGHGRINSSRAVSPTHIVSADGTGDFPTIQDAINAAVPGEIILASAGTYFENLSFTPGVGVRSISGPGLTIIDGQGQGTVVAFNGSFDSTAAIVGFTITGGQGGSYPVSGGGIQCINGAAPLIANNIITDNQADYGGGIFCKSNSLNQGTAPIVRNNIIEGNRASTNGGGLAADDFTAPIMDGNVITGNWASGNGGGVYCFRSSGTFEGNIVALDTAALGSGLFMTQDSDVLVDGNTFWDNYATSQFGATISIDASEPNPVITNNIIVGDAAYGVFSGFAPENLILGCNDIWNNTLGNYGGTISNQTGINGNISVDPLLCVPGIGDFRLESGSPCISPPGCGLVGAKHEGCVATSVAQPEESRSFSSLTVKGAMPNPFNPSTSIRFELDHPGEVDVRVYNVQGELVRTLISGHSEAGAHSVVWNGKDEKGSSARSGVYFYEFRTNGVREARKIILLR